MEGGRWSTEKTQANEPLILAEASSNIIYYLSLCPLPAHPAMYVQSSIACLPHDPSRSSILPLPPENLVFLVAGDMIRDLGGRHLRFEGDVKTLSGM